MATEVWKDIKGWATLKELGDAWGVSKANVHSIVKNKTWRHI